MRTRTAALAPAVVAAVVVAGVALGGCARPEYRALVVGQCLPSSAEVVGQREPDPDRVPCTEAHRYEVYEVSDLVLGGSWPGAEAVDEAAQQRCYERFEERVGVDPLDLPDGVLVVTIGPTEDGWGEGDRAVECLVQLPEDREGAFIGSFS